MNARRSVVGRVLVLGCALFVTAFAAESAQAGPKPESPPQLHSGSTSPQPVPWSNSYQKSSATTGVARTSVSTDGSASVSTPTRPVRRAPATAGNVDRASSSAVVRPSRSTTPRQKRALRAPAWLSEWPIGLHAAAGLNVVQSVESSKDSSLLFVAGIALVLIVIAEASFLRIGGSRLGVAGARAPAKRRHADEPLPIRRVQLRR